MKYLYTFLISIAVSIGCLYVAFNYLPIWKIEPIGTTDEEPILGTTITTIAGTDTIKDSRTTINNNFTALNNGKIEVSTTTMGLLTTASNLTTIGTIISGGWNGTAITGAYGGTSSTTLSVNQVLLGNTTSGVKVVNGYGTAGQLLTSAGAGNPPVWASPSVDVAVAYDWTGRHTFTDATFTNASTTNASTTNWWLGSVQVTASAAELNKLDNASANVTATNLNTMTAGATSDATALHYHGTQCDVGMAGQLEAVTGNQVISHNLGVTPTRFSFIMLTKSSDDSSTNGLLTSSGVATSTSVTQSVVSGNVDGTGYQIATSTNAVMYGKDRVGNVEVTAILSAATATNFTINWTVNADVFASTGNYRTFTWTVCK